MKVTYDYTGKVVVITGAATGIGHAVALAFANCGADIAVCDYNPEKGQATVDEINALGKGKAAFFKCDVSKDEDVAAMKEAVIKEFGTVDILIGNAGVSRGIAPNGKAALGPPFTQVVVQDWQRMFNINLFGNVRLVQAFYDVMTAKKEGKIIFTASISAFTPSALQPQYSASKIGVINLVQSLSVDLGPHNINVNCVCPGFVYTPMYEDGAHNFKELRPEVFGDLDNPEDIMNRLAIGMSAMRRPQSPQDMANGFLFLASDAAREITGQYLNIDSGIVFR